MRSFVVVVVPTRAVGKRRYLWNEEWLNSVRVEGSKHGVTLLAPKSERPTFPFALAGGGDGQFLVEAGNQGLVRGSAADTYLFFQEPEPYGLALRYRGTTYFRRVPRSQLFGKSAAGSFDLFPDDGSVEGWSRHLLREVRDERGVSERTIAQREIDPETADGWVNPVIFRFELGSSADALVAATEGAASTELRRALGDWLGGDRPEGRVLAVIPELSPRDTTARALGWSEILRRRPEPPFPGAPVVEYSAIERFLVGGLASPEPEPPWSSTASRKPPKAVPRVEPVLWTFLALDALGGRFVLEGHGSGAPRYTWQPPEDWDRGLGDERTEEETRAVLGPSAGEPTTESRYGNARWLARELVKRWRAGAGLLCPSPVPGGPLGACSFQVVDRSSSPPELAWERGVQRRWSRAGQSKHTPGDVRVWPLRKALELVETEFAPRGPGSAQSPWAGRAHGAAERAAPHRVAALLGWLCDELQGVEARGDGLALVPEQLHRARLRFEAGGEVPTLRIHQAPLLQDVARELLVPVSPLLVALPEDGGVDARSSTTEGARFGALLNVIEGVPFGCYAWVAGLLKGPTGHWPDTSEEEPPREYELARDHFWWNEWHPLLFRRESEVAIRFAGGGLELGESTLGNGQLGADLLGLSDLSDVTVKFIMPFD